MDLASTSGAVTSDGRGSELYDPRFIKRSPRASQAEMEDRRARLYGIVGAGKPMTVRQVFYRATIHGIVEKTEDGYKKVQRALTQMRRSPYRWITDNTRLQQKPATYDGIGEVLEETARFYRRNLWSKAAAYVEVWIEKDALSGVVWPVTREYDVPLMVARGYSSITFLNSAAADIADLEKPAYIFHFGDYDLSGQDAARNIEKDLRAMAPDAEIHFERIAVTPAQIAKWDLPGRPTKTTDSRAKKFASQVSVELDAIEPNRLRDLARECIERHIDWDQLELLKAAEKSEREFLVHMARNWDEKP